MSSSDDVPRLLDEPGENLGELGLGLRRMSANVPSAATLAKMAAGLGIAPTEPLAPPSPSRWVRPLKIAAGAGVVGAIVVGILRTLAPTPDGARTPEVAPMQTPSASPAAPSAAAPSGHEPSLERAPNGRVAPAEPAPTAPAPAPGAEALEAAPAADPGVDVSVEKPRASAATPSEPSAVPAPSPTSAARGKQLPSHAASPSAPELPALTAPQSESALLRDARLALNGDAARALALTERHRTEYPGGGLTQEREVIAITALARLGRASEAQARAARFRNAYPTSPYLERIDRALSP